MWDVLKFENAKFFFLEADDKGTLEREDVACKLPKPNYHGETERNINKMSYKFENGINEFRPEGMSPSKNEVTIFSVKQLKSTIFLYKNPKSSQNCFTLTVIVRVW